MAQDFTIPRENAGIASHESESWGQVEDLWFGDTPAPVTLSKNCTVPASVTWPALAVVNVSPSATPADPYDIVQADNSGNPATHVLVAAVTGGGSPEVRDVQLYAAGHFNLEALVFDTGAYATALSRQRAFEASVDTQIYASPRKHLSENVNI